MSKLKKMYLITGLLTIATTPAFAAEMSSATSGPYMSINVGMANFADSDTKATADSGYVFRGSSTSTAEFDSGFTGGGSLGYGFGNNIRLEGEIAYQKNDVDQVSNGRTTITDIDAEVNMWSFLGIAYYDFTNSSSVTPYLSAGLGFGNVEIESSLSGMNDNDTVPVAQLGAGIGYAVNQNVTLDFKYRYLLALTDPEYRGDHYTSEAEVASHNLMLGLRFGF